MGKLLERLNKQLKTENKQDAEDCIKIYEELKRTNDGHVWESQWNVLTTVKFSGSYPNNIRTYKPSSIGRNFLNGIEIFKQT